MFTRPASFLPGVTDIGERLQRAYAIEVARVDQNGDGALSFAEADVEGSLTGCRTHGSSSRRDPSTDSS